MVANKSDLNGYRAVKNEQGIELAKNINASFIELSALRGNNVKKLLKLIEDHYNNIYFGNDRFDDDRIDDDRIDDRIKEEENIVILDDPRWIKFPSTGPCNC